MERKNKAIATFGLVMAIPVLVMVPGIANYPLTAIGGVLGAVALIHAPTDSVGEVQINEVSRNEEELRNRAKGCTC